MGVEIVKAAVVFGKHLSGNAYKVLVCMSLQALDKPKEGRPAGLYFGGWGALQHALGYEEGGPNSAGHTAVKRAIKELRDGLHISPMVTASRGTRQSYLVHPGGIQKGVSDDPKRGSEVTLKEGQIRPKRGSEETLLGRTQESRGLSEDINLIQRPQPHEAILEAAAEEMSRPHKFQGNPGADCLVCDKGYANRKRHPLHLLYGQDGA